MSAENPRYRPLVIKERGDFCTPTCPSNVQLVAPLVS